MKYYMIALLIHFLLFFVTDQFLTLGEPDIANKHIVPISYNVQKLPPRIDNIKTLKKTTAKTSAQKKKKNMNEEKKKSSPKKVKKKNIEKNQKKIKKKFKSKIKEDPVGIKKTEQLSEAMTAVKSNQIIEKKKTDDNEKIKEVVAKKDSKAKTPVKEAEDDIFAKKGNFTANADGTYTAFSAEGLKFEIIHQVDPDYPRQAEVIRYGKTVIVEVKFLVDIKGRIETIEIINSHKKFGFDKEVIKALRKWRFKPIIHKGKKLKVYFNKKFIFKSKS